MTSLSTVILSRSCLTTNGQNEVIQRKNEKERFRRRVASKPKGFVPELKVRRRWVDATYGL